MTKGMADFAFSELKAELDAALIQLGVHFGVEEHNPLYSRVQEAGDALFKAALLRKFGNSLNELSLEGYCRRG